jgi:NTP pyrophosphatase (non-canonical NTP hydrolase)
VGEIGEFANILKKLALVQDRFDTSDPTHGFEETKMKLTEELIDGLIYIIRIASYLHIDIEKEYLIKLDINRRKYHKYEL